MIKKIERGDKHYIDVTSDICPMTFVKTKLLIEKMKVGEIAEVKINGQEALDNISQSLREYGHKIISVNTSEDIHLLQLKKT